MDFTIPVDARLPESCACRDDRPVAPRIPGPFVQDHEVLPLKDGDPVCIGFQVVDQADTLQAKPLRHGPGIHHPGEVGGLAASIAHGSGNTEGSSREIAWMQGEEFRNRCLQAGPFAAWKGFFGRDPLVAGRRFNKCEPRVGAAYVACQNHDPMGSC